MIRFDAVGVRYPRATRDALSDVSLEAVRGELTAIVGPNGSGKSTLIRALIGRVAIARGVISIDEIPVSTLAADERARRVAVVTQREDLAFALQGAGLRVDGPISASGNVARRRIQPIVHRGQRDQRGGRRPVARSSG